MADAQEVTDFLASIDAIQGRFRRSVEEGQQARLAAGDAATEQAGTEESGSAAIEPCLTRLDET